MEKSEILQELKVVIDHTANSDHSNRLFHIYSELENVTPKDLVLNFIKTEDVNIELELNKIRGTEELRWQIRGLIIYFVGKALGYSEANK